MAPPPPSATTNGNGTFEDVGVHAVTDTSTITLPDALTASGTNARRAKNPPFKGGIAASTNSDLFKTKVGSAWPIGSV